MPRVLSAYDGVSWTLQSSASSFPLFLRLGVADIGDSPVLVANSYKKQKKFKKENHVGEMGKSKKAGKTLSHTKPDVLL